MTDDDFFRALAARIEPFLTHKPDSGINPPPPNPPSPPAPPIIPVPVPVPGVSSRWDSAPSQWAKWAFITAGETLTLQAKYDAADVSRHIGWYQVGGVQLFGRHNPDNSYEFVDPDWPYYPAKYIKDTGGLADTIHAMLCTRYNKSEIAPLG